MESIIERKLSRLRNRYFFFADLLLVPLAVFISYALRFDGFRFGIYEPGFVTFLLFLLLLTPLVFFQAGLYARYWRYASVQELQLLVVATAAAVLLTTGGALLVLSRLPDHPILPRSIPLIVILLAVPLLSLPRLAVRLLADYTRQGKPVIHQTALIMGAGDAGVLIARELRNNPQLGIEVVGFLDDDPRKRKMRIHGMLVLGSHLELPRLVETYRVNLVIIAIPTAPGKTIRDIVTICELANVATKIIPGVYELLNGNVSVQQLRDVELEDLLRREPVRTDTQAVGALLRGKRVLVTGAGGSIGSELCRQVLQCEPAELVLLGHGENSIFGIHAELNARYAPATVDPDGKPVARPGAPTIVPVIADVRFPDRLRQVFAEHRPQVVFHAAAHKHVPLMEANPAEAIGNNVLGTRNLLAAAVAADVERFVMISTDKAVNPSSVMGASKRVSELLIHQAARQHGKQFVAVRFGNVLGSRGSVVPTFKRQLAAGGPLVVTHPEMKRYFMTIPEAVQLVLQAAVLGRGGEVFVLDMGEPIKILSLAEDLIRLSGLEVGRDIDIVFSGLRPGEKLYEELFVAGESYRRTEHEKILIADNASRFVPMRLDDAVQALATAAANDDSAAIVRALRDLVPEYSPTGPHATEPVAEARSV